MVRFLWPAALLLAFIAADGRSADEKAVKVDNPAYQSWAKAAVGTTVVMKEVVTLFDGKKLIYDHTYTLKAVTPQEARIEHAIMTRVNGKDLVAEKTTYPELKQKLLPADSKPEDAAKPTPRATASGKENVKIGTKEYAARKFTSRDTEVGDYIVTRTYWYSDDVPGLLLKREDEKKSAKGTFKETTSRILVEIKAP